MKYGIFVLTALVLTVLLCAALKPKNYLISRSIEIHAPAQKIFPYLNNQAMSEKWSPWPEVDPHAKMVYSGIDEGVGAKASWESDGKLGTGSATIVESLANKNIRIKLDYTKPMTMTQNAEYILESKGDSTVVTWQVHGENHFMSRLMCLFMNMDKLVGGMFEKGLNNLKSLVEKPGSN